MEPRYLCNIFQPSRQGSAVGRQLAKMALVLLGLVSAASTAADFPIADRVLVEKGERKLHLLKNGEAFRSFDIALGMAPEGHKEEEGDSKTPEGLYLLDARNPNIDFFLSIHVSYPNADDRQRARERGVSPGGAIMIHGQPNVPTYSAAFDRSSDWTDGCIAVSNSDMIDIWLMTPDNVPIEIRP
jgi:murein L,D-transpeptidase YafK